MNIEPANHEDDIEAVIACLGDDAAGLRDENPEDERADNMDVAAATIRSLCKQLDEARSLTRQPVTDAMVEAGAKALAGSMADPHNAAWGRKWSRAVLDAAHGVKEDAS